METGRKKKKKKKNSRIFTEEMKSVLGCMTRFLAGANRKPEKIFSWGTTVGHILGTVCARLRVATQHPCLVR